MFAGQKLKHIYVKEDVQMTWWKNNCKNVDNLDREDLLQYNTKKQNDRLPLVITYSKVLPNIHKILKKYMKILYNSEKMKRIFDEPPIVSYKRDTNIKDILVHRKHNLQFYG